MRVPRWCLGTLLVLAIAPAVRAAEPPAYLPRYDLDIRLDVAGHTAHVRQRTTWTNRHARPAQELVFNAHSHYSIPDSDVALLAKTMEILRAMPSEALDFDGAALNMQSARLVDDRAAEPDAPARASHPSLARRANAETLEFHYRADNDTALVLPLPRPVMQGESVTVELEYSLRLPQKMGRWGQWKGVTFLVNWVPVLAVHGENGWEPVPFIPWHQPFYNEAGVYTARLHLPADHKVACSAAIKSVRDLGDGNQEIVFAPRCARDFALVCSPLFQEFNGEAGGVRVRVLALPEHEYYARQVVRIACEAIPVYNQWFGQFPYPEFTIVESYFGWLGNECGGMVKIDYRMFALPQAAVDYVDYLVSHEICHQWWYNVVGTNGYAETWMDEALATHFSHRLMDVKHGRNNPLLRLPQVLHWMPNIYRDNYRNYSLYGSIGRGDLHPTVQEMPKYGHLINLSSMCYDRGSKIVGMIEDRLGEAAFFDFMRIIYKRYYFRILRVADFQRELEEYTGRSWDEVFRDWLYGKGMTDWCIEKVTVKAEHGQHTETDPPDDDCGPPILSVFGCLKGKRKPHRVTVILHQKAEYDEQTVVGFRMGACGYEVRVPVLPQVPVLELENPPARVEVLPDHRVRVEVVLPDKPRQIAVDPDQVLVDREPANNFWKRKIHWRFTPLYTALDETDLTCEYDQLNVIAGPWLYLYSFNDPWYTRSTMAGLRVGVYRTQQFWGGAYAAYRTDYRDMVAGLDGTWQHAGHPAMQYGFNLEKRLGQPWDNPGPTDVNRAMVFGRYVFQYHGSLYLPPMEHVEAFGVLQDNFLPFPKRRAPGAERPDRFSEAGVHYHIDYLTPYWDAEGGYRLDATLSGGVTDLPADQGFIRSYGQVSYVKGMPAWLGPLAIGRMALRLCGAAALPAKGEFFTMGGSSLFRGFDLGDRQGNVVWVGSVEWRIPLLQHLNWDCCDHVAGLRSVSAAAFYDVGDTYVNGQSLGPVAHALGAGLRLDVAWFSFIERTMLRFDVAKTVNVEAPWQFWFSVAHPF